MYSKRGLSGLMKPGDFFFLVCEEKKSQYIILYLVEKNIPNMFGY